MFSGPIEAYETYIGGKEANEHDGTMLSAGRGRGGGRWREGSGDGPG